MMRVVCLLLFVVVLMSCNNESNPKEKGSTENDPCISDTIVESGTYDLGEFHIKFDVLSINYCSTIDYEKTDSLELEEKKLLEKDSKFVWREGDKLILKLDNGKTKVLESVLGGEGYDPDYHYGGYLPEINKYMVCESGWEWWTHTLIDKTTGDSINIGAYNPVISVSPNRQYFACRNTGGAYNEEHAGLTIYSNTPLPKIIHRESDVWYGNDGTEILPTPIKNFKFNGKSEDIIVGGWDHETYELKWIDNKTIEIKVIKYLIADD